MGARHLGQSCGQLQVPPQPEQFMRCPRQDLVDQWGISQWVSSPPAPLCAGQAIALVSEHLCPVSNNDGKGEDEEEKGWGRDVTRPV